jgi:hypothetical protein
VTILVAGRIFALAVLIITVALGLWGLSAAKGGRTITIRPLAGMAGINEAVRRCVEIGRPVFFTTDHGGGGLYSAKGPDHMAGMGILYYLSKLTAKLGVDLKTLHAFPELVPIAEETVRQAYIMEGEIEKVNPSMFQYLGRAFSVSYIGQLIREKAGAAIVCGSIWPSTGLQITEPGVKIGAIQVGGVVEIGSIAMLAATCDYTFIGEELYVAGALASEDPIQLGVTLASDIIKMFILLIIIAGVFLTSMGMDISPIFGY